MAVKKFFKFLLILLIWSLIGAAVLVGVLMLGEPWTLAAKIVGGLFVAWLLFLGLRRLIVRYRAKRRVEQLVNVEQPERAARRRLTLPWRRGGRLESRFKKVLGLLRHSRLRDRGDPLYVLPWYLLLGHDGSGKTSLLQRARLPAPTIDHAALRADDASVAWWLTNEAVLLDAPGGYVSGERRHPEWTELLNLLLRHREREPLNGIVVSIPLDRLQSESADALFERGRALRKRIDELMRTLRLRLPVYVLVTKCDQLPGFDNWCELLPREALDQPMGYANPGIASVETVIRQALTSLTERIKVLLLPVINQGRVGPDVLRLSVELERLRPALQAGCDGLFQGNVYEESPLFRGIYFTGGVDGDQRQAFAQSLFTEVLPKDRAVRSTLGSAEKAEQFVRRVVLSGWGIAVVIAALVLSNTYLRHKSYLQDVAEANAGEYVQLTSLSGNINQLYQLREMILGLETRVDSWWMPWFGLSPTAQPGFEQKLKNLYLNRFREETLKPVLGYFDDQTRQVFYAQVAVRNGDTEAAVPSAAGDQVALYVGTIVRRINILNAYLNGADEATLNALPGPFAVTDLFFAEDVDPLTAQKMNVLYLQSLLWSQDPEAARGARDDLRQQLVSLLQMTGEKLSWLIPWANEVGGQGFGLTDFWIGSGSVDTTVRISPAFTLEGKEAIEGFFTELQAAGIDPVKLESMKTEFDRIYQGEYLRAWERFALDFDKGEQALRGRTEWVTAVDNLATPRNPYFQLLDTMNAQLAPFAEAEDLPDWAHLVGYYQQMLSFAPSNETDNGARNKVFTKLGLKLLGKTGGVGKALAKQGKSGLKTKKKLDKASAKGGKSPDERALVLEEAGKVHGEYAQSLIDISFNSDTRSVSYAATANLFLSPDNPGKGDGPEARAHQSLKRLQTLIGKESRYNRAFWSVYAGPMEIVQQYMLQETSCYLQQEWQNEFLTQLEGVSSYKLGELMFGEGGKLWSFIDTELKPFVARRHNAGYVPVRASDARVPLTPAFLEFASRGRDNLQAKRDKYPVLVESLPSTANVEARYKPSKTALVLQCAEGEQTVVNYNFPASQLMNWNEQCGNVILSLDVGRYTLEKVYEGPMAFPQFLREFRAGRKRLRPTDFPQYEALLNEYEIDYIDVEFKFRGHGDVVALQDSILLTPPQQLAACWE